MERCKLLWRLSTSLALIAIHSVLCQTRAVSGDEALSGQAAEVSNSIGIKLALVPAGEFLMGTAESTESLVTLSQRYAPLLSPQSIAAELPRHRVRITKAFRMGATETTVGQFRRFIDATGYLTDAEKDGKGGFGHNVATSKREQKPEYTWRNPGFGQTDAHPVVNVSWNDAIEFCRWLSRKEGRTYRLPTEAEWEYACRAGSTGLYCNGSDPERLAEVANGADAATRTVFPEWDAAIAARDGFVFTAPVAQFRPNRLGLYDMHGNVWEWCADWYDAGYYARSPAEDPQGPSSGQARVCRGGGWFCGPLYTRSARRSDCRPDRPGYFRGFRVAASP